MLVGEPELGLSGGRIAGLKKPEAGAFSIFFTVTFRGVGDGGRKPCCISHLSNQAEFDNPFMGFLFYSNRLVKP